MRNPLGSRTGFRFQCVLFLLGLAFLPTNSHVVKAQDSNIAELTVDEVLANVREAVRYDRFQNLPAGLVLKGDARRHGIDQSFEHLWCRDGRFFERIIGPLGEGAGFDGKTAWRTDFSGMPQSLILADRNHLLLYQALRSFFWLNPNAPFRFQVLDEKAVPDCISLGIEMKHGRERAVILIDSKTWLPSKYLFGNDPASTAVDLENYKEVESVLLPHSTTETSNGFVNSFELKTVSPLRESDLGLFKKPQAPPNDTVWANRPAFVEMKWSKVGYFLIHPKINGRDVGWFILDTGSSSMTISKSVARELKMPVQGKQFMQGVGGFVNNRYRRGEIFELGPLSIHDTIYTEFDFDTLPIDFGEKIAGICGYDLFARAVVSLDAANNVLEIHKPETFRLKNIPWDEMSIMNDHPHVRCRFEGDREGLFKIETSTDVAVVFTYESVQAFRFLEKRNTTAGKYIGVGGELKIRMGQIDWIELGGKRFTSQRAWFPQEQKGVLSNAYITGFIGAPLLVNFKLILDYRNNRIAFLGR